MPGISSRQISETPVAVLDFETTGLTPGYDRVVEVSVVRIDPGEKPKVVLDTLVNPMRDVSATEIHGISDADVAQAPRFSEIAGSLVEAVNDCVIAAYNVYFDIRFLDFELRNAGVAHEPPYFCLMYLRPMLGLGRRCPLDEACRHHGITHKPNHVAAHDALASGMLYGEYRRAIGELGVHTFADLAELKRYKFVQSFANRPFTNASSFRLSLADRLKSRSGLAKSVQMSPVHQTFAQYYDVLKTAITDLEISDDELDSILAQKNRLQLTEGQTRFVHARIFAGVMSQFAEDKSLDAQEVRQLHRLHQCLSKLGWAPGDPS